MASNDYAGVHVVVGKYVGSALNGQGPNLTRAELDANGYAPISGKQQQPKLPFPK